MFNVGCCLGGKENVSILVYNLVCYMLVYMVVEEQFSQCHFSGPSLGRRDGNFACCGYQMLKVISCGLIQ